MSSIKFASQKNKELQEKVKAKVAVVEDLDGKIEELTERSNIMSQHLKNVKQVNIVSSFL